MRVVQDLENVPSSPLAGKKAVTIGNFDGCHRGHQELARRTVELGRQEDATPVALTFSPHPDQFFTERPGDLRLFTESQKTRALGELGLKGQVIQRFDEAFSRLSHEEFYQWGLRESLEARAIVVGENFRFGHKRRGDAEFLQKRGDKDGIQVHIGESALFENKPVSSSRIRTLLAEDGDVDAAALMLGRPYVVEGCIRKGDQLGRQLGVPTANLEDVEQMLPAYGVFAGYVFLGARTGETQVPLTQCPEDAVPAVFSIGIRPTLSGDHNPLRIEAHLLAGDYGPDSLYNRQAGYYFSHRLRGEVKFDSLEALKDQMNRDIAEARKKLGIG